MTDPSGTPRQAPPAAWYRDRSDPSLLRYWDGARWTEHTHPAPIRETLTAEREIEVVTTGTQPSASRDALSASLLASVSFPPSDGDASPSVDPSNPVPSGSALGQEATGTTVITPVVPPVALGEAASHDSDQAIGISVELRELASLREEGVLTAEEFEREKQKLLGNRATGVAAPSATTLSSDRLLQEADPEAPPLTARSERWTRLDAARAWARGHRAAVGVVAGAALLVGAVGLTTGSRSAESEDLTNFCSAVDEYWGVVESAEGVDQTDFEQLSNLMTMGDRALSHMANAAPDSLRDDVLTIRNLDGNTIAISELQRIDEAKANVNAVVEDGCDRIGFF